MPTLEVDSLHSDYQQMEVVTFGRDFLKNKVRLIQLEAKYCLSLFTGNEVEASSRENLDIWSIYAEQPERDWQTGPLCYHLFLYDSKVVLIL